VGHSMHTRPARHPVVGGHVRRGRPDSSCGRTEIIGLRWRGWGSSGATAHGVWRSDISAAEEAPAYLRRTGTVYASLRRVCRGSGHRPSRRVEVKGEGPTLCGSFMPPARWDKSARPSRRHARSRAAGKLWRVTPALAVVACFWMAANASANCPIEQITHCRPYSKRIGGHVYRPYGIVISLDGKPSCHYADGLLSRWLVHRNARIYDATYHDYWMRVSSNPITFTAGLCGVLRFRL
jgi:hypothetical protein